jgi:hypothetical protein
MRIAICISVAIASAMLSSSALAADPQQPQQVQPKKKDPSQQIICKDDTYVGSHIPDRVCKTRAEWDEAAKQSQQYLDRARVLPFSPPKATGG